MAPVADWSDPAYLNPSQAWAATSRTAGTRFRIADHPFSTDRSGPPQLRFDQEHEIGVGAAREERSEHEPQRDERQISDHQVRRGSPTWSGVSSRTFCRSSTVAGIGPQRPRQLSVAHVDRDHVGGAAPEQNISDPQWTHRIQAAPPSHVNREASGAPMGL